jgi:hypothetical protein
MTIVASVADTRWACIRLSYQSHGKAWQHRVTSRLESTLPTATWALSSGQWLVQDGPSSDNAVAALPTYVSVYTWLSQAGWFKRTVVTSNVERVTISGVDMAASHRGFARKLRILISISPSSPGRKFPFPCGSMLVLSSSLQAGERRQNHAWKSDAR